MSTIRQALDVSSLAMAVASNAADFEVNTTKSQPEKYEGYLLKKKKWPLKGWHRRYFFLDNGFLKYAKSPHGITKNKLHGLMDMGMSVMSTKKNALTIDLDAEDIIFHLKVKSPTLFQHWVSRLRIHRDFRLHELKKDATLTHQGHTGSESLQSPSSVLVSEDYLPKDQDRMFDTCNQDLSQAKQEIILLGKMVAELQSASAAAISSYGVVPPSPSFSKKDKKSKKSSKSKAHKSNASIASSGSISTLSVDITSNASNHLTSDRFKVPGSTDSLHNLSRSNPDLSATAVSGSKNLSVDEEWKQKVKISKSVQSTPTRPRPATFSESGFSSSPFSMFTNSLNDLTEKQNRFISTASHVQKTLTAIIENMKSIEEMHQNQTKTVLMKNTISQLTSENMDLRSRLQRIHNESNLSEPFTSSNLAKNRLLGNKPFMNQFLSESQLSITETVSEMFYDAEEYLISDEESTSDEESEPGEDEASSDAELSDGSETTSVQSLPYEVEEIGSAEVFSPLFGRRTKLPCHKPDTDVSLWNILKKNIGKDLSKVAMPVTLNEPLNALQLLCEELEYSELLDKANSCDDVHEQMIYVAAFAISAYGSTHTRAGQKPFNPILGETYECVREDKSFHFLAEQVSHHPPISVCYCDGRNFEFWQDSRFKNKFWGKSMEIFPIGSVHIRLKRHDRHFQWKKVTSCVHNIVSGTRWIEHYGDMIITCGEDTCKVSFSKSGYWSSKNGEITGTITDENGDVKHKLQGKWFEGVFCDLDGMTRSIWRPNPMPADYEKQYGFSRFAIELNELTPEMSNLLPRTDTRFRPDQRCLENGDVPGAEKEKVRVEQLQRDQKKQRDLQHVQYEPLFFRKLTNDEDEWLFKGDYWTLRQDPGFKNCDKLPVLW